MTADLDRLGLQPDPDHPDAEFLALLRTEADRHEAWTRCVTEDDRKRWMSEIASDRDYLGNQEVISRAQPVSLLALLAKADYALQTWRELKGNAHQSMFGVPATTLLQMIDILSRMTEAEVRNVMERRR